MRGVYEAARKCLVEYGGYCFTVNQESSVEGASSRVDYVAMVNDSPMALCEAKSPSVMKNEESWQAAACAGHRVGMDSQSISRAENSRSGKCSISVSCNVCF